MNPVLKNWQRPKDTKTPKCMQAIELDPIACMHMMN